MKTKCGWKPMQTTGKQCVKVSKKSQKHRMLKCDVPLSCEIPKFKHIAIYEAWKKLKINIEYCQNSKRHD